jgi:hypothetical protein
MANAKQCGCDPDAKSQQAPKGYRCRDFPDCAYGVELTTYAVEVRKVGTDEVVRSLPASSERAAETIERGINRNMNHDDYYTEIVTVPPDPAA